MADVSRYATGMTDHPDAAELRERYERIAASNQAVVVDGLVLLAGLWLAISPWVVHFSATAPDVAVNNLILGLTVAVVGLGLTMTPERMYRLSWATVVIGIWVIVSQWVIQQSASTTGVVINNIITGGITALLGFAAVSLLMAPGRSRGR